MPCSSLMKAFSEPFHLLLKGLWHLSSANFLTRIHFHTNNTGIEPNYFIRVLKFPAKKVKRVVSRLGTNSSNVRVQYIFGLGDALSLISNGMSLCQSAERRQVGHGRWRSAVNTSHIALQSVVTFPPNFPLKAWVSFRIC